MAKTVYAKPTLVEKLNNVFDDYGEEAVVYVNKLGYEHGLLFAQVGMLLSSPKLFWERR